MTFYIHRTWQASRPPPHACVVCAREQAIKAIGDFPITHVTYAWMLTVKAGDALYEQYEVVCIHDCIQCEALRSLCCGVKCNRPKHGIHNKNCLLSWQTANDSECFSIFFNL
jgi:hypothetical protein